MEESKQLLFQAATLWEHIGERRFYVGPEGVMVPPETFFDAFSYWEDGGQQLEDGLWMLNPGTARTTYGVIELDRGHIHCSLRQMP